MSRSSPHDVEMTYVNNFGYAYYFLLKKHCWLMT